jgi:hypothetical protein
MRATHAVLLLSFGLIPARARAQQAGGEVVPGLPVRTDQIPMLDTVVYQRSITRAGQATPSGTRTVVRRIVTGPGGSRRLVVEQRFPAGAGEIVDTSIAELPTLRALGHRSHQPARTMRFDFVGDEARGTRGGRVPMRARGMSFGEERMTPLRI